MYRERLCECNDCNDRFKVIYDSKKNTQDEYRCKCGNLMGNLDYFGTFIYNRSGKYKELTYEELLKCNGKPVWFESTNKWLSVHEECEEIKQWIIPSVINGVLIDSFLPWGMVGNHNLYGKYWLCYERML